MPVKFNFQFIVLFQIIKNAVIPTKAKPHGGIYALSICVAGRKCEDPSTPLRSAQDDNIGGNCKINTKLTLIF